MSDCEECDDGNNVPGDGCLVSCKVEAFMEPNNTFDQALIIPATVSDQLTTSFIGADTDFFKFSLAAGKTIKFTDSGNLVMMAIYDANKNIISGAVQGTNAVKNSSAASSFYYLSLIPISTAKPFLLKLPYVVSP